MPQISMQSRSLVGEDENKMMGDDVALGQVRVAPRARVLSFVQEGIMAGTFEPGQPVPSERELARLTGVSAGTVNTALKELETQGVLRSNGGRLRYVARRERGNRLLERTFVLIGAPRVNPIHRATGWKDWIDQGVLDAAQKAGMHCLVCYEENLEDEWEDLLEASTQGICVNELFNKQWPAVRRLAQARRCPPIVVFGNETGMATFDRVSVDHEAGGYAVTRHLIESGRRRVALVCRPDSMETYWFRERRAGYERALREAELEVVPLIMPPLLHTDLLATREEFSEQARHLAGYLAAPLLSENVDALIALTDRNVPALAEACQLLRRAPGDEVALAGYDNYWNDCREREWNDTPPLASLDKSYYECGRQLFELLCARTRDELPASPQMMLVQPHLVRISL